MSLIIWLPLISNTNNQGLSNPTITTYGTLSYNAGKLGNALTFNNTAIMLNPAPITTNIKEFSFAFWFKTTSAGSTQAIYNGRTTTGGPVSIFVLSSKFRFDDGAQNTFNYTISNNEWHHYVFTRDENNIKLYVDGVLNQTMTSTAFTCNTNTASIGRSSTSGATPSGNTLVGQLQDYRIYNHVLSKKEINELKKGLIMHLPLDWGGNENLIINSENWFNSTSFAINNASKVTSCSVIEDDTAPVNKVLKVVLSNPTDSTAGTAGPYFNATKQMGGVDNLIENEIYTYSFWAKGEGTANSAIPLSAIPEAQTAISSTGFGALTNKWRFHTRTFKFTTTDRCTISFYSTLPANTDWTLYICGLKLEKGSKATPWVPNKTDTSYTSFEFNNKYLTDCSGFNNTISAYGSNILSCEASPRYTTGTLCGASSCINLGQNIKVMAPFSFTFWFKTSSLESNANRLISCTESGGWNIEARNSGINFPVYASSSYRHCTSTTARSQLLNSWHHIVCIYDGYKSQIYIDGILDAEEIFFTSYTNLTYNNSNSVFLGGEAQGGAANPVVYATDTNFSDFRFYGTVLSVNDIQALYKIPFNIDKDGKFYGYNLIEE